jgi:rhamnogalacturonan endolyase
VKTIFKLGFLLLLLPGLASSALAQRQMENLGRGVVAVRTGTSSVYVGWRLLGNDPEEAAFNLYRSANGGAAVKLNGAPLIASCNFNDTTANLAQANAYSVHSTSGGIEGAPSVAFTLPANAPTQQYLNVPLQRPPGGTTFDGVNFSYAANDCSVGDVDGDGEYEIILKWDPSNAKDNSQSGFTGNVLLDCYRLNGTRLWRIDLGSNVRAGAHYTQFMVYDFDGDGHAELMCRTAPGARDGLGNYVGGAAKWQNANGARPSFNNTDD